MFFVITLCTCIDPYSPEIKGYDSLLVVEGQITDDNSSYQIKLSRTIQKENMIPEKVSDAVASITDNSGGTYYLINFGGGIYKTDSTKFIGKVGSIYTLHIKTRDGNEYRSEPCQMLPVPLIDSIYYEKYEEFASNQSESQTGIRIYLDSKPGDGINNYFRWEYIETWKFMLPQIKRFDYINEETIVTIPHVNEFCWKTIKSGEILTKSVLSGQTNFIQKEPLVFIASDKSNRLTIQYSILVKQYSVSKKEFDFWNNLKQVNESGGDIFDSQPYPVISNISNINNSDEKVLGYFQVSAVSQKRKDITFMELTKLDLPLFNYGCSRIETEPADYCKNGGFGCVPPTWDQLYQMWTYAGYVFVEPIFFNPITRTLRKLVFSEVFCSDCALTGTYVKPDFWIDLN